MNWKQPKIYAVRHKDEAIRLSSRLGGILRQYPTGCLKIMV